MSEIPYLFLIPILRLFYLVYIMFISTFKKNVINYMHKTIIKLYKKIREMSSFCGSRNESSILF
jgi:hypothetical protein